MHEHILWEARPHIPFTPDEVNIDYEVIESSDSPPDEWGSSFGSPERKR